MAANNILGHDVPVYHKFVDNQVLTDNQLNEVLDHLNYQDKLTRTSLIGVGIVCGLKISTSSNSISLSSGVAVTTDGDILKHKSTIYRGYKVFKDENVLYNHFLTEDKPMDLYELETDTTASDVFPLSQFQSKTNISTDRMVALLYLEHYYKEEEDCSPVDCNSQGQEVVNRLRVLVTSVQNAKIMAGRDSIFKKLLNNANGDVLNNVQKLLPKRVILNSGNTASYNHLKNAYTVNFHSLENRLKQLSQLSIFNPEISKINFSIDQFFKSLKADGGNFQYIYDLYRDLCLALNELLSALDEQYTICCPDTTAFPKHVLLGEVHFKPIYLRHSFYPSPIHNNHISINQLRVLFRRIVEMLRKFLVNIKADIRITPSKGEHFSLGERALPIYYDLEKASNPNRLIDAWNKGSKEILNYYRYGYPSKDYDPLDYCMDAHDFYRIEGHLGKNVFTALKSISGTRTAKGLAFDVIPIAVGNEADEDAIDFDKYKMYFEDLQTILQAWNEEQKCIVKGGSQFLSGFSHKTKGNHIAYEEVLTLKRDLGNLEKPLSMGGAIMEAGASYGTQHVGYSPSKQTQNNVVLESIITNTSAMGSVWNTLITNASGGSDMELTIKDALKDAVKDWESELVTAAVDIPARILGKMKETEDNKLLNIEDFTLENLKKYIEALKSQCEAASEGKKLLQAQINKESSMLRNQPYIENYQFVLNKLISSCCIVERVRVLYEKILERKRELLGKLVLKEYVKAHPGLEHKGGVEKGGTFILLYHSLVKPSKENLQELDDLMQKLPQTNPKELKETRVEGKMMMKQPTFYELAKSGKYPKYSFEEYYKENSPEVFEVFAPKQPYQPKENLGHGIVIGDLCLPYICCSDMPATTFVFPDQEVELFIGKDFVCKPFDGDAEQVILQVTPIDGQIKTFTNESEVLNLIENNGSNFFFNPNKLDPKLYGETIKFTVNDQNVAPTIKVLQKPEPSFTAAEKIDFLNKNTLAKVTFENTSPSITGQEFTWDFGQGETVSQNALKFEHFYNVEPGQKYEFKIILTGENGPCNNTSDDALSINVPGGQNGESCVSIAEALIKKGKSAIEDDLRKNSSILKGLTKYYTNNFLPLYDLILKDIEATLKGNLDTDIFGGILALQKSIVSQLNVNLKEKEQEFLLRLFYENLLLYFYVQACRTSPIISRKKITGVWENFTNNASDTYIKSFKTLIKDYPVHEILKKLLQKENKRLSAALIGIMESMIKAIETILV